MSTDVYFTRGALDFLRQLRKHNNREWFQDNKERYERQLRDPFLRLIADLAPYLKKIASRFVADPSPNGGSMMRIYRDIRFSKDKSPYKTFIAAHFWHMKGKAGAAPTYYLRIEPGASVIGGGIWQPDPRALKKIRDRIVAEPQVWQRVTSDGKLGSRCMMAGESLKRPPAGYDANHPLIEDIKRKDFSLGSPLTDKEVCSGNFKELVLDRFRSTAPFLDFLSNALGLS